MREDAKFDVERIDSLVERLIGAAVLAGAYEAAMREDPILKPGFTKLADKHRARVAALADEMLTGMAWVGAPSGR